MKQWESPASGFRRMDVDQLPLSSPLTGAASSNQGLSGLCSTTGKSKTKKCCKCSKAPSTRFSQPLQRCKVCRRYYHPCCDPLPLSISKSHRGNNFSEWRCSHCIKEYMQQSMNDRASVNTSSEKAVGANPRPTKRRKLDASSGLPFIQTDKRGQLNAGFGQESPSKLSMKASEASTLDCITVRRPGDNTPIPLSKKSLPRNSPKEEEFIRASRVLDWITTEKTDDSSPIQLLDPQDKDGPAAAELRVQTSVDDHILAHSPTEYVAPPPADLHDNFDARPPAPMATETGTEMLLNCQQRLEAKQATEPGTQASALSPPYTPPHCADDQDQSLELLDSIQLAYDSIAVESSSRKPASLSHELTHLTPARHVQLSNQNKGTQYSGPRDSAGIYLESGTQKFPTVALTRESASQTSSLLPAEVFHAPEYLGSFAFQQTHFQVSAVLFNSLKDEKEQLLRVKLEQDNTIRNMTDLMKAKQQEGEKVVGELQRELIELKARMQEQEREIGALRFDQAESSLALAKLKLHDQKKSVVNFNSQVDEQRSRSEIFQETCHLNAQQLVQTAPLLKSAGDRSPVRLTSAGDDSDDLEALVEGLQDEGILPVDSDYLDRMQARLSGAEEHPSATDSPVAVDADREDIEQDTGSPLDLSQSDSSTPEKEDLTADSASSELRVDVFQGEMEGDGVSSDAELLNQDLEVQITQADETASDLVSSIVPHVNKAKHEVARLQSDNDSDRTISEADFLMAESEVRVTSSKEPLKDDDRLRAIEPNEPKSKMISSRENALFSDSGQYLMPVSTYNNLIDKLYNSAFKGWEGPDRRPEVFRLHDKLSPDSDAVSGADKSMSDGTISEGDDDQTIADSGVLSEELGVRTVTNPAKKPKKSINFMHAVDGNKREAKVPEAPESNANSVDNECRLPDSEDEVALLEQAPLPTEIRDWTSKIKRDYRYSSLAEAIFDWSLRNTEGPAQELDIEAKKAEIAARPSRKATFGKVLANVRKERGLYPHRSGNFHSEIPLVDLKGKLRALRVHAWDGRPGPQCGDPTKEELVNTQTTERSGETDENNPPPDDEDDLKDEDPLVKFDRMMGVPENAIPCLVDNQLAYRDGSRDIRGRLPRTKLAFKVGRNVAGQLR